MQQITVDVGKMALQGALFMSMKLCPSCKQTKPHGDFHRNKAKADGCCSKCKTCTLAGAKARYDADPEKYKSRTAAAYHADVEAARQRNAGYRATNREKIREADRARRAADPERLRRNARESYYRHHEDRKELLRQSYQSNKEKHAEAGRRWAKANPEKRKEIANRWVRANLEYARAHSAKRRALKRGAEGFHTVEDLAAIREAQEDRCAYCNVDVEGKGHFDHIYPLSRGGSNWPSNIQLTCAPCNLRKSDRDPIEFAKAEGYLF